MSNHTPGPWKNDGRKLITTVGIAISTDKSLGPIAVVSEENAPLVLAAPEMYEALKKIQRYLDIVFPSQERARVAKINALLAKIEGETP
jgi:hypothetical protein